MSLKKRATLWQILGYGMLFIVLCLLPIFLSHSQVSLIVEMMILALGGMSLNLIFGNANMINFGHAGPYALGAYSVAILTMQAGVPFWIAMIVAPLIGALFYFIVGWLTVRRVEIYFALLTFAYSLLIWTTTYTWYSLTGGEDGLTPVPVPEIVFLGRNYYYFTLSVVVICIIVLKVITDSPFGNTLRAIRENAVRTEFIGINIRMYKFIGFVLSGFFAGIAGALYAGFSHGVYPGYGGVAKSTIFMLVCIMGGMYNFSGPIVGAVAYLFLYTIITSYTERWPFVFGSVMVLVVLFFRGGIVGFIEERWRSWVYKEGKP